MKHDGRPDAAGRTLRVASWLAHRSRVFAVLFAFGAVNHAIALAWPHAGDGSPPWRHASFVAINVGFAAAFAARSRYVFVPALVLAAQQEYSHGSDLVRTAREGTLDVSSLLVVLFMPLVVLAAWGARKRD